MRRRINKHNNTLRARQVIAAVLLCICLPLILPAALSGQKEGEKIQLRISDSVPTIKPQIPKVRRGSSEKVFLERADRMLQTETDTFVIVTGNVEFSHGAMLMYCDSAHFYLGSESLDAFGNVRMRQGDTLFIYADELNYYGDRHIAYLYGKTNFANTVIEPVRMINRDVTLTTPTFIYDLADEFGYYNEGGELSDRENRLISQEGEYIPSTKEANFYTDVVMTSRSKEDTLKIYTDTLFYNTNTHIAQLISPSTIISADATIETSSGTYNTETSIANLFDRSKVVASTGTILIGDTLIYDRNMGIGEVFGNMVIDDTTKCLMLYGDYGYYNELTDSAFATGKALAKEYSQGDTLYLHAKYLYAFSTIDTLTLQRPRMLEPEKIDSIAPIDSLESYTTLDTTYVMIAHPRVRFYRDDMQGLCDSMRFEQRDSMLYMYHHPVVWSGERQIFGNQINLHLNDSTIERATLPNFAFTAEHVEGELYNQLAGKEMIAYFVDGDMRRLDVNGNVQIIMLPTEEKDSTINKIVNAESSFLTADFLNRQILRMKMWPETSGTVTPLYLASKKLFRLPQFQWYTGIRPTSAEDVMIVPPEMDALMSDVPQYDVPLPESYIRWLRNHEAEMLDNLIEDETPVIEANIEDEMPDEEADTSDAGANTEENASETVINPEEASE